LEGPAKGGLRNEVQQWRRKPEPRKAPLRKVFAQGLRKQSEKKSAARIKKAQKALLLLDDFFLI